MKKSLSILLAIAMVFTMFSGVAFAAEESTDLAKLKAAGVIIGDLNGDTLDGSNWSRQNVAVVLSRLFGVTEAEAQAAGSTHGFTDVETPYYNGFISWAKTRGLMQGKSETSFGFNDDINMQEFATVLIRALNGGITANDYNTAISTAIAAGIIAEGSVASDIPTRGDTYGPIVNTLNTEVEAGVTLGAKLELEGFAPVVVDLAVSTVTASNLAEIVVNFNSEVDSANVKVANFEVDGAAAAAVSLSADKNTVTVTPAAISTANGHEYAVVVKKAAGIEADYTQTVKVIDSLVPVVESVTLSGPQEFKVKFSEPLNALTAGTVLIENGIYGSSHTVSGSTVTVTLGAQLADANYTVKISGFADYAGYAMSTTEKSLTYVKDLSALTASISSAKQNEVKVKFNKKIATTLTADHFYHTFSAWKPDSIATSDNQTYTLTFTTYTIPEGNFNLVVSAVANTVKVTDVWGVDLAANATLTASVTADATAPTVALKKVVSESAIQVEYSESVTGAATASKYVVKNANGDTVSGVSASVATGNVYDITFGAAQPGGVYTVTISGITDTALTPNTIAPTTLEFTITDMTPPTVSSVQWVDTAASTPEYVYVTFNEAVAVSGTNSALDKNNYRVNGTIVPSEAVLFGTSGKKVRLSVTDTTVVSTLVLGQIADTSGNKMVNLTTEITGITAEAALNATNVTSITTKSVNQIEIVIDKVIPSLTAAAFTVEVGANIASPAMISYSNNGTKTTVLATLTANTNLSGPAAKPTNVNFVVDTLVTDIGTKNVAFSVASAVINDGIAPSVTTAVYTNPTTFTITFDENIALVNVALAATDLTVTYDGNVLVAGSDYTVNASTNTLVITHNAVASGKKLKVEFKAEVNYISDGSGNAPKPFSKEITIP